MPRLDAIGIVSADIPASIAFYRRLGVDFPEPTEGEGHIEATLAGGIRLMLDTIEIAQSIDSDWTPPSGGHGMSLAFLCGSPGELNDLFDSLVADGVEPHKEPWDAFWGQRYAQIKDPDGNIVDLFAPLDG